METDNRCRRTECDETGTLTRRNNHAGAEFISPCRMFSRTVLPRHSCFTGEGWNYRTVGTRRTEQNDSTPVTPITPRCGSPVIPKRLPRRQCCACMNSRSSVSVHRSRRRCSPSQHVRWLTEAGYDPECHHGASAQYSSGLQAIMPMRSISAIKLADPAISGTRDEQIRLVRSAGGYPLMKPASCFYSDTGICCWAILLERITQLPLAQAVRQLLLRFDAPVHGIRFTGELGKNWRRYLRPGRISISAILTGRTISPTMDPGRRRVDYVGKRPGGVYGESV